MGRNPLPSIIFGGGGFWALTFSISEGYEPMKSTANRNNLFFTLTNNFKQTHYEKVFLRRIGYRRFGSVRTD